MRPPAEEEADRAAKGASLIARAQQRRLRFYGRTYERGGETLQGVKEYLIRNRRRRQANDDVARVERKLEGLFCGA